jgi:hypothetical protein
MSTVSYEHAARRHLTDAETLLDQGRLANAGQLYGFAAECGLKAMLIACGVELDAYGGLPRQNKFYQHMPALFDRVASNGYLIPDGPQAVRYMASMPNLAKFQHWSVDHRYWGDAALPLRLVPDWQSAAKEVTNMLDQAKQDGVL